MQGHTYNAIERALHHLALGSPAIAEMAFDLNLLLSRGAGTEGGGRHVFVSGLARAGTTIIMRRLHATRMFRSLTYRDMPFVLCPNLWERISAFSRREIEAVERAHGDRLLVDADSPEALDEVFWRVFAGEDYIAGDYLRTHRVDDELIEKFRQYVSCILHCRMEGGTALRYLSKNNNNILRLPALRAAFPDSFILIPFRDPIQHANSLLIQHRKFSHLQAEDRFARSYMTWLAHHEFGLEHKPFRFEADTNFKPSSYQANDINYWLEAWIRTYGWLCGSRPTNAIFLGYEDICSDPALWNRVLDLLDVAEATDRADTTFSRAEDKAVPGVDSDLAATSAALYRDLRRDSERSLSTRSPMRAVG
ncbi:MAG: sulfotransferase [Dongiaceae bacterium]